MKKKTQDEAENSIFATIPHMIWVHFSILFHFTLAFCSFFTSLFATLILSHWDKFFRCLGTSIFMVSHSLYTSIWTISDVQHQFQFVEWAHFKQNRKIACFIFLIFLSHHILLSGRRLSQFHCKDHNQVSWALIAFLLNCLLKKLRPLIKSLQILYSQIDREMCGVVNLAIDASHLRLI